MKQRLVITGAAGFLGRHLLDAARRSWQVIGVVHSEIPDNNEVEYLQADLTVAQDIARLFREARPDAMLHAAALSNPNDCQIHPAASQAVNVTAAVNLARHCAKHGIPYLFTSTDLCFDGAHAPYRETDRPDPLCLYGEHKVLAEQGVREHYPPSLICRLPLMFGLSRSTRKTFYQTMVENLAAHKSVKLFVDEFRTPVSFSEAAKMLLAALGKNSGILHLGGPQRISRYEFGRQVAARLNFDVSLIQPCLQEDIPMAAPRPKDVSLDSRRSYHLIGVQPLSLTQQLSRIHEQPG